MVADLWLWRSKYSIDDQMVYMQNIFVHQTPQQMPHIATAEMQLQCVVQAKTVQLKLNVDRLSRII
jgi:hypothetical protein